MQNANLRQLLVDVTYQRMSDFAPGIRRVVGAVVTELLRNPPAGFLVEPVYVDNSTFKLWYGRDFVADILGADSASEADHPVVLAPGDVFLGLDLNPLLGLPKGALLLRGIRASGTKIAVVMYDILPIRYPEWWPPGRQEECANWMRNCAQAADQIVSISRTGEEDVKSWLRQEKIHRGHDLEFQHFHLGADFWWPSHSPTDTPPNAMTSEPQTFLMVGSIEPRKGYAQVLDAFEVLWWENVPVKLTIVGNRGWMTEELVNFLLGHRELGKRLNWLEGVDDEYLSRLYMTSTCLIAAADDEGFGLPLIEAAKYKLPIIARDLPIFREVAGDHAFYFKAKNGRELAEYIKQWRLEKAQDRHPKSEGMRLLTWSESTRQLQEIVLR
jgi:glycosyltransferase involved in cell wall biosynthesis